MKHSSFSSAKESKPSVVGHENRKTIQDLLDIMATLRAPGGCPWDRKQTHRSLLRYLVEETYEVVHAIEDGDMAELPGELGDLLLQIVFHAQMASERRDFDFSDVTDAICRKLIRRHPHVFEPEKVSGVDTPEKVLLNWEKIKQRERGESSSVLDGLPRGFPALLLAQRMQDKAASAGFDWKSAAGVMEKLEEEIAELRQAWAHPEHRAEELGDLLFTLVNMARHLKLDAEDCLRASTAKFEGRFRKMEQQLQGTGRSLSHLTPHELDELWKKAKGVEDPTSGV